MNYFVYACMERERWCVPKYTVEYSQRGRSKKIQFFEYVINDRPVIKKRLKNKLAKLIKNFVFKLIF